MYGDLRSRSQFVKNRFKKLAHIGLTPKYWRGLRHGVAPALEHDSVPLRSTHRTIYDVGANKGQFALLARHRYPSAEIICFEPLPGAREVLRRVLGDTVEIRPFALGRSAGPAILHVAAREDSSSLREISDRQVREFPGTDRVGQLEVEVSTLDVQMDASTQSTRLLKVDVQGFELEVLEGAGDALSMIDEALIECSFIELYEGQALAGQVVGFMNERGYELSGIYGTQYNSAGLAIQADLLFNRLVLRRQPGS